MKKNYLEEYTIIHTNKPNEEQMQKMISNIQNYFDRRYGKSGTKKEKPAQNFSLDNCTTNLKKIQERGN